MKYKAKDVIALEGANWMGYYRVVKGVIFACRDFQTGVTPKLINRSFYPIALFVPDDVIGILKHESRVYGLVNSVSYVALTDNTEVVRVPGLTDVQYSEIADAHTDKMMAILQLNHVDLMDAVCSLEAELKDHGLTAETITWLLCANPVTYVRYRSKCKKRSIPAILLQRRGDHDD